MNAQQNAYILPLELHQVLAVERISVSPTGEQKGQGADFYAFVFDLGQEDAVNAFGGTPTEAVAKVLSLLGKPYVLADADVLNSEAAVAAIQFALDDDDGMQFLRLWNGGDFDDIRREWPEAPEEVFMGADPLHKPSK
jgi:hypothetical protein